MMKKAIIVILLKIKKAFRLLGIDIAFVKKEEPIESIQINTLESTNNIYASKEYQNTVHSKAHQKFFHQIIDLIDSRGIPMNNKMIADFGCGVGNLLFHISNNYKPESSYGFDFSQEAIYLAKKRFPSGIFKEHDIYFKLELKWDMILCTETLEHLLYPEKALKNLLSVLKNKGFLLITVPDGRKDTFGGHINFWSLESWNMFIEMNCTGYKFETGYINKNNLYAIINLI